VPNTRERGSTRFILGCVREVLTEPLAVWEAGETAGVDTVVRTFRSAPRPAGASMVVAPDGTVSGSVSGGCVEGAVYELANDVVRDGAPRLERYGISDGRCILRRAHLRRHS
jgi:xanthine dehydrogenase accessory factor